MVQKVTVSLADDLDGGEADGTVEFGLDGANYQIDLSEANGDRLREALAPFVDVARRTGKAARSKRSGNGSTTSVSQRRENAELREWARKYYPDEVGDRGRIATHIREAFNESKGK